MLEHLCNCKPSIISRSPFLLKGAVVSVLVTVMYLYPKFWVICSSMLFCFCCYFAAKTPLRDFFYVTRLFFPVLLVVALSNLLMKNDPVLTLVILLRIVTCAGLCYLLSISTPMEKIMKECTVLFYPLRYLGIPHNIPALLIAVILRTIPLLIAALNILQKSHVLRGGKQYRSYALIVPLLIQTMSQCTSYAHALMLRGFKIML